MLKFNEFYKIKGKGNLIVLNESYVLDTSSNLARAQKPDLSPTVM